MRTAPYWHQATFLRLLPPFVGGLLVADSTGLSSKACVWTGFAVLLLLALSFRTGYSFRWISGLCCHVLLLLLGVLLYNGNQWPKQPGWFGHRVTGDLAYIGTPETFPLPGARKNRQVFRLRYRVDKQNRRWRCQGKIQVYTDTGDVSRALPGEWWLMPATGIQRIRQNRNPGAFDFAAYAARQHLYHQVSLQSQQLLRWKAANWYNASAFFARCQLSAIQSMRDNVQPSAQGLAMALLVGYRQEVDKELLQRYTDTGTIHVIAVSGMHLGLLFWLLQLVLQLPVNGRWFVWTKAMLVLLLIGWFSAVAGAAPSILRAALMFGWSTFGKLLFRSMNAGQSLAFTAFGMLCVESNWCWDAGFLLSFAALGSIVLYQPLISNCCNPKNPLLKQVWSLTAVTLAAQVLTFPVSVYLFHQAPLYFLGANLVAVPLSSLALVAALLQWGIAAAGIPFSWPGIFTGWMIEGMNAGVSYFQHLPGAVWRNMEWSVPTTLCLYAWIAGCTLWLTRKSKPALRAQLAVLLIMSVLAAMEKWQLHSQGWLLVYHSPGKRAVDIVLGDRVYVWGDSGAADRQRTDAWRHMQVRGKRLLPGDPNQVADIRFLPANSVLLPANTDSCWLADGRLRRWQAQRWDSVARACQHPIHNTWNDGLLVRKINIKRTFAPP